MNLAPITLPAIGQNVRIRALEAHDVPALYDIESDQEVKRYLGGAVVAQRDEWIAKMRRLCPNTITLAIQDIFTGSLIGRASIAQSEPHVPVRELSIVLGRPSWGRNLGTEVARLLIDAARAAGESEIQAKVHPKNRASIALLRRLGFLVLGNVSSDDWDSGFLTYTLRSGA